MSLNPIRICHSEIVRTPAIASVLIPSKHKKHLDGTFSVPEGLAVSLNPIRICHSEIVRTPAIASVLIPSKHKKHLDGAFSVPEGNETYRVSIFLSMLYKHPFFQLTESLTGLTYLLAAIAI